MSNDDLHTLKTAYALLVDESAHLSKKMRDCKAQLHALQIKERTAHQEIQEAKSELKASSIRQHLDDVRGNIAYYENEYHMTRTQRAPYWVACEAMKELIEIEIVTYDD